jgi:pyridoxine/pyridoxamine 5'-phosphate oxidase
MRKVLGANAADWGVNTVHENAEDELRRSIWEQLERAVTCREHAWRLPVLANVDRRGLPQARTVVLRGVDAATQQLRIFTDHRSPKALALTSRPQAVLVFWSQVLSWQLRVAVDVRIETGGPLVDEGWERISRTAAAADYLSLQAPGSPIQSDSTLSAGEHALGIMIARVRDIDWLELSAQGHRRARLTDEDFQWLVP